MVSFILQTHHIERKKATHLVIAHQKYSYNITGVNSAYCCQSPNANSGRDNETVCKPQVRGV